MTDIQHMLIVDDDETFSQILARSMRRQGFEVWVAHNATQALTLTQTVQFNKAIVDLKIDRDSGLQLIPELKRKQPALSIIMLTGYSSIATAVEAVKLGATNYLCKPATTEQILSAFTDAQAASIPETPPSINRLEWEHIQRVLNNHHGNISATARALGMHRRTLQRKLQKKPTSQ